MMLADANSGSGWDHVPSTYPSPSPTMSPSPTPTPDVSALPVPTEATESAIEVPSFDNGSVDTDTGIGFSWLVFGIIVVAIVGTIVTLYLRNRK